MIVNWIAYGFLLLMCGAGAFFAWQYVYKRYPKEVTASGLWMKNEFAEWFVGSWAKIISWAIVVTIFINFLIMDGYFSRGLGEGSGVDPNLFMHIGWMFRCFAAVFLVLAVKFTAKNMKDESVKLKMLGLFCSLVVIAHAAGFGLKALEGKRAQAVAVEQVEEVAETSNMELIATLEGQKEAIRTDLAERRSTLDAEIRQYITDGLNNDELADDTRARRTALEDAADEQIRQIDAEILSMTTAAAQRRAEATQEIATTEKWAPLFVGLAQLFTWSKEPSDWAIYVAGVCFLMAWILLGDAIVIFVPPALYRLHLKDAEFDRRSNASKEGHENSTKRQMRGMRLMIEDLQKQVRAAQKETVEVPDKEVSVETGEVTEPEQTGTNDNPTFDPKENGDDPAWKKPDSRNALTKPATTDLTVKEDADGDDDSDEDESERPPGVAA